MPRKSKSQLFGVFDEQAVSVLACLARNETKFGDLRRETGLSKASLSRVLKRLHQAAIVRKTAHGYTRTETGREILGLVLRVTGEHSRTTMAKVENKMSRMRRDYRLERRIFHHDAVWERTGEKALVEVMSMRTMTALESLLFYQRFQEEARREEQKLRRSATTP